MDRTADSDGGKMGETAIAFFYHLIKKQQVQWISQNRAELMFTNENTNFSTVFFAHKKYDLEVTLIEIFDLVFLYTFEYIRRGEG